MGLKIKRKQNLKFVSVPLVLMGKSITANDLKTYLAIASRCQNPDKACKVSLWDIGKDLDRTEISSLKKAFDKLIKMGLVKRERTLLNESFTYTVLA